MAVLGADRDPASRAPRTANVITRVAGGQTMRSTLRRQLAHTLRDLAELGRRGLEPVHLPVSRDQRTTRYPHLVPLKRCHSPPGSRSQTLPGRRGGANAQIRHAAACATIPRLLAESRGDVAVRRRPPMMRRPSSRPGRPYSFTHNLRWIPCFEVYDKASSNWLGKVVMGVVMGFLVLSFAIWGIGDIFRGFGVTTVAKIGNTEITDRAVPPASTTTVSSSSAASSAVRSPPIRRAPPGIDQQLLGQIDRRGSARRARASACGSACADAEVVRRITEEPAFRGPTGQFDQHALRQRDPSGRLYRAALRRRAAPPDAASPDRRPRSSATSSRPRPRSKPSTGSRTSSARIEYVVLDRDQAGRVSGRRPPEVLAKYFEDRKVLFRAPEYRKIAVLTLTAGDLVRHHEVSRRRRQAAPMRHSKARYSMPEKRAGPADRVPERRRRRTRRPNGSPAACPSPPSRPSAASSDKDIDLGLVAKTDIRRSGGGRRGLRAQGRREQRARSRAGSARRSCR